MDYAIGQVRLHLLTAVMKCFFKRPPETQNALGAALAAGIADFHQVWVCLFMSHQHYCLNCQLVFWELNLLLDCRMFMTEPYSTIGFYSIMYLWQNVWWTLQSKLFLFLLILKAVKLKIGYLMNLTVYLLYTRR